MNGTVYEMKMLVSFMSCYVVKAFHSGYGWGIDWKAGNTLMTID